MTTIVVSPRRVQARTLPLDALAPFPYAWLSVAEALAEVEGAAP